METLKKIGAGILAVALFILAIFGFVEHNRRKTAEAKLENADNEQENAVLKEKLSNLNKEQAAAVAIAEVEKGKKMSLEELENFFNEKK